jgi:hypothetical protein
MKRAVERLLGNAKCLRFQLVGANFELGSVAISLFFALLRFEGGCPVPDGPEMIGACPEARAEYRCELRVAIGKHATVAHLEARRYPYEYTF